MKVTCSELEGDWEVVGKIKARFPDRDSMGYTTLTVYILQSDTLEVYAVPCDTVTFPTGIKVCGA